MLRTKTTESKPVARTPDNVAIKPQRMGFEFGRRFPITGWTTAIS